jgi:hypothetical protein
MSHTIAPNSLPVSDGYNYTFWKIRMRAYLKSIDVWHIVESGWINPNKASAEFSKDERLLLLRMTKRYMPSTHLCAPKNSKEFLDV